MLCGGKVGNYGKLIKVGAPCGKLQVCLPHIVKKSTTDHGIISYHTMESYDLPLTRDLVEDTQLAGGGLFG